MLFTVVAAITAAATLGLTRRTPHKATTIGIAATVLAAGLVAIAEITGNLLAFYLGAVAAEFGVIMIGVRAVEAVRRRASERKTR